MPTARLVARQRLLSSSILPFVLVAVLALDGCSQKDSAPRAMEGRGLLPRPTELKNLGAHAVPDSQVFHSASPAFSADSSSLKSLYWRDRFETDEGGSFTFRVRELSVPPGRGQARTALPVSVLLEMRSPNGTLKISGVEESWKQDAIIGVPARAVIELTNPTDRELIVRFYFAEDK